MVIGDDTGPRLGAGDGNKAPVSVGWACGCSCLTLGDNELAGCCCTSCDAGDEDTAARPRGSRADHRIRTGETAAMLRVAEALRDHMKALLRANQIAWKQGPDQAARELERCVTKLGFKVVLSIISRRTFGPPQAATSMPRRSTARSLRWAPIACARIMPRAENSSIRYRSARATVVRSCMATPRRFTNCGWELKSVDALTPQLSNIGGADENPA